MRMCHPEQLRMEIAELRRCCPFSEYEVPDSLIRAMVRQSNPARVRMAFRECRQLYNAARQSWAPSLCRKMTIRVWKAKSTS